MKKQLIIFLIICALMLAACQPSHSSDGSTEPSADPTGSGSSVLATGDPNGETGETADPTDEPTDSTDDPTEPSSQVTEFQTLLSDYSGWYNVALTCLWESPEQLELRFIFYNGFKDESKTPTDEEVAALQDRPFYNTNLSFFRLPVDKMNQILTEYYGITLDDVADSGFEGMEYLESTDCYYLVHSDANMIPIEVKEVQTTDDGAICVYYTRTGEDTLYVVMLMPNGDGYRILSNVAA